MMSSPKTLENIRFPSSQPLASVVRQKIERQIYSGELKGGDRLNEQEIARNLGVSRAPLRENLRTLEQAGLVVSRKNYDRMVEEMEIAFAAGKAMRDHVLSSTERIPQARDIAAPSNPDRLLSGGIV